MMIGKNEAIASDIEARLASSEWDLMIARRVLSAKKARTRKKILAAAIIPLFMTAGLFFTLYNATNQSAGSQDDLISRQINGTYASVFTETPLNGTATPLAELDTLVDNALSKR